MTEISASTISTLLISTVTTIPQDVDILKINVLYTVFECLVAIFAVIGNSLVLIAFKRERKLRRRTNYYIVSLAAADLLVGLLGIPFAILASVGLPTQLHACLFTVSLLVMLCTISIFSLVAVSADRYWAIIYPMGYSRNVRTRTAIGIIVLCWVAGSLVGLLPLLGWNAGGPEPRCRFVEVMDYNYLVFLYFATIIFPALLLLASYSHIYLVVRRQIRQMASMQPVQGTKLRILGAAQRREVKAAQNLAIIVLFFIICWIPLYTINCIKAFCPTCDPPLPLTNFCIILSHLNSAVNPLLYAYHLRDFRAALRNILCPCSRIETNDHNTFNGRMSVGSTNRVHNFIAPATAPQDFRQHWPQAAVANGMRRRSSSVGDPPIIKETKNNETEPACISRSVCQREVRSESSVWLGPAQVQQVLGRCHSVEIHHSGLINTGFECDAEVIATLSISDTDNLAKQVLTRTSSSASNASHEALMLKDKSVIQITRCEKSLNDVRS